MTACSEKENAAPRWKRTFGCHPLAVFANHGPEGAGEPLAIVLRSGNAGSNTAVDHIEATRLALAQLPAGARRQVLIRTDSGAVQALDVEDVLSGGEHRRLPRYRVPHPADDPNASGHARWVGVLAPLLWEQGE